MDTSGNSCKIKKYFVTLQPQRGVTQEIQDIINSFKAIENQIDSETSEHKSNEVLQIVRPYLEHLQYTVETGKGVHEKLEMCILIGY